MLDSVGECAPSSPSGNPRASSLRVTRSTTAAFPKLLSHNPGNPPLHPATAHKLRLAKPSYPASLTTPTPPPRRLDLSAERGGTLTTPGEVRQKTKEEVQRDQLLGEYQTNPAMGRLSSSGEEAVIRGSWRGASAAGPGRCTVRGWLCVVGVRSWCLKERVRKE